jgi:uncharacterized coiled-coil DUF342 family protein
MTTGRKIAASRAASEGEDSLALRDLVEGKADIGSVKRRAFGELKKFSRSFIGVALLCDDLGDAADLDEAMVEVRREHDRLSAERDVLLVVVDELRTSARVLEAEIAGLTDEAQTISQRMLDAAKETAAELVRSAHAEGAQIVAGARATAAAEAERQAEEAGARQSTIAELSATIEHLGADIAAKQAEYDGVATAIAELRVRLGG